MKNLLIQIILPIFILSTLIACYPKSHAKRDRGTSSQRMNIHRHGISIDARYDPRLDNLIPGYKILTVGLKNEGFDVLKLNPLRDRWEVVDAKGKKVKAINSLRIKDPSTFSRLPPGMQQMISYPVGVAVRYSENVDLFFPKDEDLNNFRSISFYSSHHRKTYDLLSNLRDNSTYQATPKQHSEKDPRFRRR